ncbi:ABC transporter [Reticulomyxa filosa]|uniref:ABC transporter n=1 Tax=Reticulomyxa filosa TaxID=46433 RepID=X6MAX1_RETFI|nr:ABC transporter [Reticulomyxa filosa]|eukprot:ETO10617.1 ABC transporter [Reticulomyxa filosa]
MATFFFFWYSSGQSQLDEESEVMASVDAKPLKYSGLKAAISVMRLATPRMISVPSLWSALLMGSLIWKTRSQSSVNDSIGRLGEIVVKRKWNALAHTTMEFAVISVHAAIALATADLLQRMLSLSVRYYLTNSLQKKYRIKGVIDNDTISGVSDKSNHLRNRRGGQHILRMIAQIPDADARMTKDVEQWSDCFSLCVVNFTKPIIDCSVYSTKLVHRIGMYQFAQCIFYFFISGLLCHLSFFLSF